jgi:hypothetical protein
MSITIEMVRIVRECWKLSDKSWDAAIDTAADGEPAALMAGNANDCSDRYEQAVDALLDGDLAQATIHLDAARALEAEHGCDQHGRRALAALLG